MATSRPQDPHEAPAALRARPALSPGRFGRFVVVGGAATAVHYLTALALLHAAGWGAVAASAAGAAVGAVASYGLNARFTFGVRGRHGHHAPRFAAVAGLGWMLNALGMWGLLRLGLHPYLAQPLVTVAVLFCNFALNALWAMRTAPPGPP